MLDLLTNRLLSSTSSRVLCFQLDFPSLLAGLTASMSLVQIFKLAIIIATYCNDGYNRVIVSQGFL